MRQDVLFRSVCIRGHKRLSEANQNAGKRQQHTNQTGIEASAQKICGDETGSAHGRGPIGKLDDGITNGQILTHSGAVLSKIGCYYATCFWKACQYKGSENRCIREDTAVWIDKMVYITI